MVQRGGLNLLLIGVPLCQANQQVRVVMQLYKSQSIILLLLLLMMNFVKSAGQLVIQIQTIC